MSKLASAAYSKQWYGGRKLGRAPRLLPKEGSQLRIYYDILMKNKGEFVFLPAFLSARTSIINQLKDFYGLDIRKRTWGYGIGSGIRGHYSEYCLVGEWKGKEYVDYLATKNKEKRHVCR